MAFVTPAAHAPAAYHNTGWKTTFASGRAPGADGITGHRHTHARRSRRAAVTPGAAGMRATASQSLQPSIEQAWEPFREKMKETNESPPVAEWNELFRTALAAKDAPAKVIWVLERMRETGCKPTAGTYEILLEVCLVQGDRAAAFLLVEKMWADKVLLGDVSLPDDMEKTLRAILPPEAFD
jgi:hypothetical protein